MHQPVLAQYLGKFSTGRFINGSFIPLYINGLV